MEIQRHFNKRTKFCLQPIDSFWLLRRIFEISATLSACQGILDLRNVIACYRKRTGRNFGSVRSSSCCYALLSCWGRFGSSCQEALIPSVTTAVTKKVELFVTIYHRKRKPVGSETETELHLYCIREFKINAPHYFEHYWGCGMASMKWNLMDQLVPDFHHLRIEFVRGDSYEES